MMTMNWKIPALITILFWFFCLFNIQYPLTHSFDEAHYIPAAKTFIDTGILKNREHPPLGKLLITPGLYMFGDTQLGWRFMSTVFGALTLLGIYFWSFVVFESTQLALLSCVLTIANFMLYVQARIAMLDTFMMAFLIWAFAAMSYWWKHKDSKKSLWAAGLLFGLSAAVKWFALIPFGVCGLILLYLFKRNELKFLDIVKFTVWFIAAYAVTFIPMVAGDPQLHFSVSNFIQWQIESWNLQRNVVGSHPYTSQWWSWPLQLRPIWYAYDKVPDTDLIRGVVLLGNPILIWGTVLAIAKCVHTAIQDKKAFMAKPASKKDKKPKVRSLVSEQVLLAFFVCFLAYAVIPRKVTFFYYYYPAGLVLSLVWTQALRQFKWKWIFAGVCVVLFIYFLPVLGAFPIHDGTLGRWMWFRSWI
jgi:dolichyl-phosphate-mannose--protein O-mannosyl transferase